MDVLLVIAIAIIALALLGFSGIIAALRAAAWIILVVGIVVLILAFVL
jgi:uncharacterized membrane protein YtjA (UPF0391 family)